MVNDQLVESTLSDVCSLVTDGTHDTPKQIPTGFPLVKAKEIVGGVIDFVNCACISEEDHKVVIARSNPEYGDTLFTHIGASLGEAAYIKTNRQFSIKNIALFKPNPSIINGRYLFYLTISPQFQELAKISRTGSAQPFLSLGHLRSHRIKYHKSLKTQRKIAGILSAYDDLIENNTRRIAILEEMAQRIYKEWFVDFKYPGHENDELVDSELGMIPEGWEVKKLGDIAEIKWGDTSVTKQSYVEKGYTAYSASGPDGFLEYFDYDKLGVVLSAIGANCGITWLANGKWSCIKNTILFFSKSTFCSTEYIYMATKNKNTFPKRGAAQPFISQNDCKNLIILVPNESLMKNFSYLINTFYTEINLFQKKNANLRQTRDLLLPKLISGKIKVNELGG